MLLATYTVAAHHRPVKPLPAIQITIPAFSPDSVSCIIPFSRAGNLVLIKAKADTTEGVFILDTGAAGLVLNITYFRNYPATTLVNEEATGMTGTVAGVTRTTVKDFSFGCIKSDAVSADLANLGTWKIVKGYAFLALSGYR